MSKSTVTRLPVRPDAELRRDLRRAQIACKGALALLRAMEAQGALRLPFPRLDATLKALKGVVEE